ncbi:hypothetical protein [Jiangella asiatica]|uniref:Uncharacterized protein n=1 Tax=Jiangella asiatica TaxID=2530372 RepID=A0A4R5CRK2_9ACTN|nr:hypothetical protein [Jiangella asiatica]TDE01451.1 hypothetical protein E1269_23005 [Jiangella asiatica]
MPSVQASLAVAALAGVLGLASASGRTLLAGGIALVVLIFTLGAVSAARVRAARWSAAVSLAAGGAALAWTYGEETSDLTPIAAVLGPTLLASVVVQLFGQDGRARLTASLAYSVSACVLAVLPVCWLALRESPDGPYAVGLALLGVGVVGVTETVPISRAVRRLLGVLLAAVVTGALVLTTGWVDEAVPAVSAVVVATFAGLMAAVAFAAVDRLAEEFTAEPGQIDLDEPEPPAGAADRGAGLHPAAAHAAGSHAAGVHAAGAHSSGVHASGAHRAGDDGLGDDPPVDGPAGDGPRRGAGVFLPLRISVPFVAAAPAAYVLGRIFVS